VTIWGIAGGVYGLVLAVAALTQPIQRRHVALVASLAFTLVSIASGTLTDAFWVNLLVPGALLLGGYWLSGFFFRDPQPWLESWLLRVDHAIRADEWLDRSPRPIAELLELSYALDYALVGSGAIYAATFGTEAVAYYWGLVLASGLASYAPLPWLRSRPPRVIGDWRMPGLKPGPADEAMPPSAQSADEAKPATAQPAGEVMPVRVADESLVRQTIGVVSVGTAVPAGPGFSPANMNSAAIKPPPRAPGPPSAKPPATRSVAFRRLNTLILDHASVQANTLPSGHVAGAVAAALGVMAVDVVTGSWLIVAAGLIAIAAIAGRYHYVIDCITGAAVALMFWLLM
jgi:hypothetical protein